MMIIRIRTRISAFCLFLVPFAVSPYFAISAEAAGSGLVLISPPSGAMIVAKKPLISLRSNRPLQEDGRIFFLDGHDVTALVTESETENIYSFTPPEPLGSGQHNLYIQAVDTDGVVVEEEFVFASRQSESFEEIQSQNTLSLIQKTVLSRDNSSSGGGGFTSTAEFPYASFDSYLTSESTIKEGNLQTSLRANLRYYDQNAALLEPEKKGGRLLDFLFTANHSGEKYTSHLEVGDTTIEESENTINYLTRRGGQAGLTMGRFTFKGFSVLGRESGYDFDGLGFAFNSNDHIMGGSLETAFFDKQLITKAIYARGGEKEDSMGGWTEGNGRKGDVTGLLVSSDFFEQLFMTDFELDFSDFNNDTTDTTSETDMAYRLRFSGQYDNYEYQAGYSYTGPQYEVIGNHSTVKDWAGFDFIGGAYFEEHAIRVLMHYFWDNVEDEEMFARIYSLSSGVDYQFSGWQHFPAGLLLEYNTQSSADEPGGMETVALDTYQVTGKISFVKDSWFVSFSSAFSEQNDKTEYDTDTRLYSLEIVPSYSTMNFSILPSYRLNISEDLSSTIRTTTNTVTLDIHSTFLRNTLSGELGGTYDWTETDDNSVKMNNTDFYTRLSYRPEHLWRLQDAGIALEYHYKRQKDEVYDSTYRENIATLVFSCAFPYTF